MKRALRNEEFDGQTEWTFNIHFMNQIQSHINDKNLFLGSFVVNNQMVIQCIDGPKQTIWLIQLEIPYLLLLHHWSSMMLHIFSFHEYAPRAHVIISGFIYFYYSWVDWILITTYYHRNNKKIVVR